MERGKSTDARLLEDPWLEPFRDDIRGRVTHVNRLARRLLPEDKRLSDWASAHEYYGLHREADGWEFREWAPNATAIWLVGDFSDWKLEKRFALIRRPDTGDWEVALPPDAIQHGQFYRLEM